MAPGRRLGAVSLDSIGAGVALVTLVGEFHHREARDLEQRLQDALAGPAGHLVVDLRSVLVLGTASLRVLVKAALRAREQGMGFALVRAKPEVWEAFELTGLDSQLPNSPSLWGALSALSNG